MKKSFFVMGLLFILVSCGKEQITNIEKEADVSFRTFQGSEILIRDYGYLIGIFHLDSGEFLYCNDCQNNWD